MRDYNRIHEICSILEEIWQVVPDWRFGQLLSNLNLFSIRDGISFYQEDDETYQALENIVKQIKDN